MTGKRRAMRQSVPAKAQTNGSAAPASGDSSAKKSPRPKRSATQSPTSNRIHKSHAPQSGSWKRRRRNSAKSSGAPMTTDPQYVTVRGKQAVAIIDAAELERLLPPNPAVVPLVQFLESLYVEGLDLTRDRDLGRDPAL